MFTPDQIAMLEAKLDRKAVATRSQSGRQLSYIEGYHAINEANRIFGFGHWSRETAEMKQLGEPYEKTNDKGVKLWYVNYAAKVRVMVFGDGGVIREGYGFGSGIDRDIGQAHESAIKEAETDAMKRALSTFGNQFGLALYDKQQREVMNTAAPAKEPYKSGGAGYMKPATRSDNTDEYERRQEALPPKPNSTELDLDKAERKLIDQIRQCDTIEVLDRICNIPYNVKVYDALDDSGAKRVVDAIEARKKAFGVMTGDIGNTGEEEPPFD